MRCHGLAAPSIFRVEGALAQLGERLVCNQEVAGSIPVRSMNQIFPRCVDAHCDVRSALLLQRRRLTFRIVPRKRYTLAGFLHPARI